MKRRDVLCLGAGALAASALARGAIASHGAAARFSAERRFLRTRLGEIAYVARGLGPPALFLHGFPLNGFQWHGATERLAHLRR
jgi:haloalkane dehalogenase